ncbi:SDR family NAD(P)-dependent oxidoreductase [Priestia taiwanensis]|uniref:UDP-glucose 4-epimerase n=1 Tax=Priestia taiwanensis TaxID=1347902 RepID=A0A917ASA5_9BACI|nr:SDR family NAD(P)-dependent oxidoreductase [Priestia taiwanensis]MBM7364161.1 UDP-glucose 4-epimerase [Priestia taiwanensis]GGE72113.1 UDP-glucose 4-epimerase [Priestia taiwanensis]
MKETILVTGGAGFIGSHICERYAKDGHTVIIVDDLSSGGHDNMESFIKRDNVYFYEVNIMDKGALRTIFEKRRPTVINHHAAQKSVPYSVENPLFDIEINMTGLLHLITLVEEFPIKNFIYVSSGGALSKEITSNEQSIETDTPQFASPYSITKFAGEQYIRLYSKLFKFDFAILRYANVYGPRQVSEGESGVIPIFVNNILAGRESKLMTYPDMPRGCTRDYVYVSDIVEANVLCLEKKVNDSVNLSSSTEAPILDIYEVVQDVFQSSLMIHIKGPRAGDVKRSVLCNKRAKDVLGWEPKVQLREGVEALRNYILHI